MTYRRLLAVTAVFVAMTLAATASPPSASACAVSQDNVAVLQPDPWVPIEAFIEDHALRAVVVGEVVEERTAEIGFPYSSDVQVVSRLYGDAPSTVTITDLGMPLECFSGPRMREGERLLLFLTDEDPPGSDPARVDWRVTALGQAVYAFDNGDAALRGAFVEAPDGKPVGSAEALLRGLGQRLNAAPADVDRAVAFALGDLAPLQAVPPVDSGPNPFAVWGAVAIALIATSIIVGWYLRGRRRGWG